LAIYGAGIVSSHGETLFALDSASPNRLGWQLERVLRTPYRIDDYQQAYFVIDSFDDLLRVTLETDFGPLYQRLAGSEDIPIAAILPQDELFTRGDQSHVAEAV
jgi:phenylalanine-4-hydroxylase